MGLEMFSADNEINQEFYQWTSSVATSDTTSCTTSVMGSPWIPLDGVKIHKCYCKSAITGTPDIMPDDSSSPYSFPLDRNPAAEYTDSITYPRLKCYQGHITSNNLKKSVKEEFSFSVRCSPTTEQVSIGTYTASQIYKPASCSWGGPTLSSLVVACPNFSGQAFVDSVGSVG